MLLSIALIFSLGLILAEIFGKIKLPRFLGMILTGILLAPILSPELLAISADLRKIALVIILLRAGLSLDIADLKQIGRPAILMSFIPALLEITAVVIFAPMFFDITWIEAAILGSVLAAVSPAVVVPKMIKLMKQGYGTEAKVPHLIMASASVDDIFVIVLFTSFIGMYETGEFSLASVALVPMAILIGIFLGIILGYILSILFAHFRVRDSVKVLIIIAVSLFTIALEDVMKTIIPISSLLSVMVLGIMFLNQSKERALRLRGKFDRVWVFAELVLFVLVGAAVDIKIAFAAGGFAILLLLIELSFRFFGVQLCLLQSPYNKKERAFAGISYMPKATVQAAIGALPLAYGVPHGELILALAVLSIIITAPLGAIGIDLSYKKLLKYEEIKNAE